MISKNIPLANNSKLPEKGKDKYSFLINWVIPIALFIALTGGIFTFISYLDYTKGSGLSLFDTIFSTTGSSVENALGSTVELMAAILGLTLTIVAIVVQLASQRYGAKLVELFLADRINVGVFAFLVFSVMLAVLMVFAIKEEFFPAYGAIFLNALTLIDLAMLLPYFAYVFKFLTPINIIDSISEKVDRAVEKSIEDSFYVPHSQKEVAIALGQITDTVLSANSQMDRNVGLMATNQIKIILEKYQKKKSDLTNNWFSVPPEHFIGISTDFFDEIIDRKIWVEAKGFMDMELIFKSSIRSMPDIISAIANNTRELGLTAIKNDDPELLLLVVEYYNTFLRISLNDKNQKAIYNLFYQYRRLTVDIFSYDEKLALKILFYFKYYGQTAMQMGIWFILVTASFDLGTLVAKAYDEKLDNISELLDLFLQVDDQINPKTDLPALKGVRKSHFILASYLLSQGDNIFVKKIIADFKKQEPFTLLTQLKDELLAVKDKKFWEVTDRGINFEYIDDEQKKFLKILYDEYIYPDKDQFINNGN